MNICICCRSTLLRHIQRGSPYWFCPQCYQAMPRAELETDYSPLGDCDQTEVPAQTFKAVTPCLPAQTRIEDPVNY